MRKTLILSLAAATILGTNLNAQNMYDRIQAMELQMKALEKEMTFLQEANEKAMAEDEKGTEEVETPDNVTSIDDVLAGKDEDSDDEEDSEEEYEDKSADSDEADEDSDEDDEEGSDDEDDEDEEIDVEEMLVDLEESVTELNKATSGNHLKFNVDYRFAIDNLQYKMADGSTAKNDALLSNRLWINMFYKATDTLSFRGQMAYNKTFGARSGVDPMSGDTAYEDFDWIASENAYDGTLRLKSAYFFYKNDTFLGTDIPWTFSIGRRPSTNGHLINYRDDNGASSPLAHTINVEFDGLSSKFELVEDWGTYIKLCAGRGLTNAQVKFTSTPYATKENTLPDIDLAGLIFVPYSDGQYSINTQYYYAANLIDMADMNAKNKASGFVTVGNLHSFTANVTVNGIGNEWSDFLEETIIFVSGAVTKTDPNSGYNLDNGGTAVASKGMLGSPDAEMGYSYWIGTQFPSFTEDGKFGLEFNHGSQYFRSITYAEDTNVGSKMATRGNAFEAYMTEYLIEDILSLQVRYTYIDYEYTGSNGFFGNTSGNSMKIADTMMVPDGTGGMVDISGNIVDKAQDIRIYLRYKY